MCEEWDISGKVTRRRTVKFTITQYVYERGKKERLLPEIMRCFNMPPGCTEFTFGVNSQVILIPFVH